MANGSMFAPKALLFAMFEIPPHIQQTFGLLPNASGEGYHVRPNMPGLEYEVIVMGETIPPHIARFIIFYYRDDYSTKIAFDLIAQIEALNPGCDWLAFPVVD